MKPAKKTSTSYSPTPMSEKAKKIASLRGTNKQAVSKIKKTLSAVSPIDTKAAKKAVGITLKTAAMPSDMARKGAKAGLKALVKDPRATQRQVGTTKPMPEKKKK
jgi:hypothetical protein